MAPPCTACGIEVALGVTQGAEGEEPGAVGFGALGLCWVRLCLGVWFVFEVFWSCLEVFGNVLEVLLGGQKEARVPLGFGMKEKRFVLMFVLLEDFKMELRVISFRMFS